MSENRQRQEPLTVKAEDVRVGDVLNEDKIYRDEGELQGAICEAVEHKGAIVATTWRILATGEVFSWKRPTWTPTLLSRRGPSASPREVLWSELGLDLHPSVSRERFEECMNAYDRAAGLASSEETTA